MANNGQRSSAYDRIKTSGNARVHAGAVTKITYNNYYYGSNSPMGQQPPQELDYRQQPPFPFDGDVGASSNMSSPSQSSDPMSPGSASVHTSRSTSLVPENTPSACEIYEYPAGDERRHKYFLDQQDLDKCIVMRHVRSMAGPGAEVGYDDHGHRYVIWGNVLSHNQIRELKLLSSRHRMTRGDDRSLGPRK